MTRIVTYSVDDDATVSLEYEPTDGYHEAGTSGAPRRISEAMEPAIRAAGEVLQRLRALRPDELAVSFGLKASGEAHWIIAKAATEANFNVTLTWKAPIAETAEPDPVEHAPSLASPAAVTLEAAGPDGDADSR